MTGAEDVIRRLVARLGDAADFHFAPKYVDCIVKEYAGKLATLGRGTCHDEGDPSDFCCSECGARMFTNTNDTYTMIASDERTIIKHPNFCPNCGRKVVDE